MKIATWNINSLKVRLPQVVEWLQHTNCDVLALQEIKQDNGSFPDDEFIKLGYQVVYNCQKTYNGVALVAKHSITDVVCDIPCYEDQQKRVIAATINGIRIVCVYVVNGEALLSDKFAYKMQWLNALNSYMRNVLHSYNKVVLLGDFNIAPADIDVHDPKVWHDKVLCSDKEREQWHRLLGLNLYDSFRIANGAKQEYTWWDYRNFAFRRKMGLRIDHILVSEALRDKVDGCSIDIAPRKHSRPSDHAPVILSLKK